MLPDASGGNTGRFYEQCAAVGRGEWSYSWHWETKAFLLVSYQRTILISMEQDKGATRVRITWILHFVKSLN